MKKKSTILGSILIVVGIILIVISSVKLGSYKRDLETYYHNQNGFWGQIEVRTEKEIDVDNAYVNLHNNFFDRDEREKLQYVKTSGDNYIFEINVNDYTIISLEFKDLAGNDLEFEKYSEQQEKERVGNRTTMIILIVVGVLVFIAGIGVFVLSFVTKTMSSVGKTVTGVIHSVVNKNGKIKCEYCGCENDPAKSKCESCGANLQSKKK